MNNKSEQKQKQISTYTTINNQINMSSNQQKLNWMLLYAFKYIIQSCRQSITTHSQYLPLYSFTQHFHPQTLSYIIKIKQQLTLTTGSLYKFVRLLQLIKILQSNIQNKKTITKRNLFYQLQNYYNYYKIIDQDIRLICYNLYYVLINKIVWEKKEKEEGYKLSKMLDGLVNINKIDLGVIASNRCVIFGYVHLIIDGKQLNNKNTNNPQNIDIITIPTCRTLIGTCLTPQIILIQKQSIFYQLVSIFKQNKLYNKYLLITAKGYPDYNTRNLLYQFHKQQNIKIIHYLGDYDIYGFDIFYYYAIGDWSCRGILKKIRLIELGRFMGNQYGIFDQFKLEQNMNKFSKQQDKKIKQINNKINGLMEKKDKFQGSMNVKLQGIKKYFDQFVNNWVKCELELFMECAYRKLWVTQIINKQQQQIK